MGPVILLHVANGFVLKKDDLSADTARLLKHIVYPTVLALAAMVGVLFGVAVIRKYRMAWASILIAWGLCGLLEAYLSYEAKVAPWEFGDPPAAAWKAADSVLIVQNLILLTVAVFMLLESRLGKNASAPDVNQTRHPVRGRSSARRLQSALPHPTPGADGLPVTRHPRGARRRGGLDSR